MVWNSIGDQFDTNSRNGEDSFADHTEDMKIFHRTHPCFLEFRDTGEVTASLQYSMGVWQVTSTISQTGGSRSVIGIRAWLTLVPMWRIALRRFSSN